MASIISAGTTSGTALNMSGDTSGVLQLATNGTTTAMTIDTSQNVFVGGTTQNTSTKPVYSSTTAKAWVNYNASTQAIINSYNVSSVTYNASADYTINYTTALANSNNCVVGSASGDGGPASFGLYGGSGTNTTTAVRVSVQNGNHFAVCVAVFG